MKDFRKNKEGLYICEECGREFKLLSNLSAHIGITHYHNKKEYYDKWIKENKEGICLNCGNKTKYDGRWTRGAYNKFCNKKCKDKYGMEEESKEKIRKSLRKTCLKKYNVNSYVQSEKFKKKARKTWIKNYGVDNPAKSKQILNKIKQTCLERYGQEYSCKNGFKIKKFRDTNLYYQGSYELDFLEKY